MIRTKVSFEHPKRIPENSRTETDSGCFDPENERLEVFSVWDALAASTISLAIISIEPFGFSRIRGDLVKLLLPNPVWTSKGQLRLGSYFHR